MKKLAVALCLGLVMSSMTACGNNDAANDSASTQQTVESTTESTTESTEATQESTEATQEGTADGENAGAEGGAENGADTGVVDETGAWSAELQAVKDSIVAELGANYWPDTAIPAEFLEGMYGITPDMYEDYLAENMMIATNVDTLIIIKPTAEQFDTVKGILETYQANLQADTMQYPMNLGKIQASTVEATGDYVYFVQLGADVMDLLESGDQAVIEHCQAENEKVLNILREAFAK